MKSVTRTESFSVRARARRVEKNPASAIAATRTGTAIHAQRLREDICGDAVACELDDAATPASACDDEAAALIADAEGVCDWDSATRVLAEELAPESSSRLSRFKSARISEAIW